MQVKKTKRNRRKTARYRANKRAHRRRMKRLSVHGRRCA